MNYVNDKTNWRAGTTLTTPTSTLSRFEITDPTGLKHRVIRDDEGWFGEGNLMHWLEDTTQRPYVRKYLLGEILKSPESGNAFGFSWRQEQLNDNWHTGC